MTPEERADAWKAYAEVMNGVAQFYTSRQNLRNRMGQLPDAMQAFPGRAPIFFLIWVMGYVMLGACWMFERIYIPWALRRAQKVRRMIE